jgi:hypothetical protein
MHMLYFLPIALYFNAKMTFEKCNGVLPLQMSIFLLSNHLATHMEIPSLKVGLNEYSSYKFQFQDNDNSRCGMNYPVRRLEVEERMFLVDAFRFVSDC